MVSGVWGRALVCVLDRIFFCLLSASFHRPGYWMVFRFLYLRRLILKGGGFQVVSCHVVFSVWVAVVCPGLLFLTFHILSEVPLLLVSGGYGSPSSQLSDTALASVRILVRCLSSLSASDSGHTRKCGPLPPPSLPSAFMVPYLCTLP